MATHILQGSDGHYFLAINREISHFTYDISQSYMLSCGFKDHQFSASDAETLSAALVECGLVQRGQLRLCTECVMESVQSAFSAQARHVGENGVFLFAYHGPQLSSSTAQSWLQGISPHPPKQVIFFLDCPSARETAKSLTSPLAATGIEKLCIFCASPQPCSSQVTSTLGHSLFSYLTAWAIRRCTPTPTHQAQRLLYVSDISRLAREVSTAIASLCVAETERTGPNVVSLRIQPLSLLQRCHDDRSRAGLDQVDGECEEETDGATVARFSFVEKFYRAGRRKQRPQLCDLAHRWLHYLKQGDTSPLHTLCSHGLLARGEMLVSVLRLLVFSLALIQESSDQGTTADPNTLIVAYVQAAGVLEHVVPSTELPTGAEQFQLSCEAYCLALDHRKVNTARVRELARKVKKESSL